MQVWGIMDGSAARKSKGETSSSTPMTLQSQPSESAMLSTVLAAGNQMDRDMDTENAKSQGQEAFDVGGVIIQETEAYKVTACLLHIGQQDVDAEYCCCACII